MRSIGNLDKHFTRTILRRNIDPNNYEDCVDKFKIRIKEWYFDIAREIGKINHSGFPVLILDCMLIDIMCQYLYGLRESRSDYYIKFLKENVDLFDRAIVPPIGTVGRPRKKGGRYYWPRKKIHDLATGFYHAFRCGVMHNGMILEYGRISGQDKVTGHVGLTIWENDPSKNEIMVDPLELLKILEGVFDNYIMRLKDRNEKGLRRKFAYKFRWDFGFKIKS